MRARVMTSLNEFLARSLQQLSSEGAAEASKPPLAYAGCGQSGEIFAPDTVSEIRLEVPNVQIARCVDAVVPEPGPAILRSTLHLVLGGVIGVDVGVERPGGPRRSVREN